MRATALVALVALFALTVSARAQRPTPVKVQAEYKVTVANNLKPKIPAGFVATGKEWAAVWKALSPDAEIPDVDFSKSIVLVTQRDAADPNRVSHSVLKDDKGTVNVLSMSTLIGFEPSNRTEVTFLQVPREGLTGVRRFDAAGKKAVVDPLPE